MYEALAADDYIPTVRELFAEDVVWHLPGRHPLSGDHGSIDAVLATMRRFAELSADTIRVKLHTALADDEHAVALLRATGSRHGQRYDSLEVDVFRVVDGKVRELWSFAYDQRRTDEFWS